MRTFLILTRREYATYFASLTGYVIVSAVLFLLGFSFTDILDRLNHQDPIDLPVTEVFYQTWYFWYVLLLAAPLITMRSFALEKATGTFETLMTTPVSDLQVVLAKFTSALLFFFTAWLPLLGCILVVRHYSSDQSAFGGGIIASTYLGILLVGALYMSMGIFASALTRSQIIAAMVSFALGMAIFLFSARYVYGIEQAPWVTHWLGNVSMVDHMKEFVRGTVDTRYVMFYLSGTVFFLFLTLKAVESRRWK
jgi:ABC-2 type transport system permease protein